MLKNSYHIIQLIYHFKLKIYHKIYYNSHQGISASQLINFLHLYKIPSLFNV